MIFSARFYLFDEKRLFDCQKGIIEQARVLERQALRMAGGPEQGVKKAPGGLAGLLEFSVWGGGTIRGRMTCTAG